MDIVLEYFVKDTVGVNGNPDLDEFNFVPRQNDSYFNDVCTIAMNTNKQGNGDSSYLIDEFHRVGNEDVFNKDNYTSGGISGNYFRDTAGLKVDFNGDLDELSAFVTSMVHNGYGLPDQIYASKFDSDPTGEDVYKSSAAVMQLREKLGVQNEMNNNGNSLQQFGGKEVTINKIDVVPEFDESLL